MIIHFVYSSADSTSVILSPPFIGSGINILLNGCSPHHIIQVIMKRAAKHSVCLYEMPHISKIHFTFEKASRLWFWCVGVWKVFHCSLIELFVKKCLHMCSSYKPGTCVLHMYRKDKVQIFSWKWFDIKNRELWN